MVMLSRVFSILVVGHRYSVYLLGCMACGLFTGCSDSRYQAKQNIRDERIYYYSQSYLNREADNPEHLRSLEDRHEALSLERDARLKNRLQDVPRQVEVREETLRQTQPVRRERVRSIFGGRPENIRNAWADMVY